MGRVVNPVTLVNDMMDRAAFKAIGLNGAQTANHANSTSPSSASLSNTAAGYTTLGGKYQFAAVGGAATDYALFAYQVPSADAARLVIKGVSITTINTGAAVATTATVLDWSLGVNGTAVDLSTAESAPVYATRRIPLGTTAFKVSDAIGTVAPEIFRQFQAGITVYPGRYLHIILQMPVGTATASQVIRGAVTLDAHFEFN